jgi:hypothetical protein
VRPDCIIFYPPLLNHYLDLKKTVSTISAFENPEGLKLDKAYEVYSQIFRCEDFEEEIDTEM